MFLSQKITFLLNFRYRVFNNPISLPCLVIPHLVKDKKALLLSQFLGFVLKCRTSVPTPFNFNLFGAFKQREPPPYLKINIKQGDGGSFLFISLGQVRLGYIEYQIDPQVQSPPTALFYNRTRAIIAELTPTIPTKSNLGFLKAKNVRCFVLQECRASFFSTRAYSIHVPAGDFKVPP